MVSVGVGVRVGTGASVEVGVSVSVGAGVTVGVTVEGVKTSTVGVIDGASVGPGMGVWLGGAGVSVTENVGETAIVGVGSPGARRMAINPAQ
jgi:hypothetical protein